MRNKYRKATEPQVMRAIRDRGRQQTFDMLAYARQAGNKRAESALLAQLNDARQSGRECVAALSR